MNTVDYLNKNVKVIIDRKMGSTHPKHGFIYPVNYGWRRTRLLCVRDI